MENQLVGQIKHGEYRADVYSEALPGEFRVVFYDPAGKKLEEDRLSGISSYHQREGEILKRVSELAHGAAPRRVPDLGDAGEY